MILETATESEEKPKGFSRWITLANTNPYLFTAVDRLSGNTRFHS